MIDHIIGLLLVFVISPFILYFVQIETLNYAKEKNRESKVSKAQQKFNSTVGLCFSLFLFLIGLRGIYHCVMYSTDSLPKFEGTVVEVLETRKRYGGYNYSMIIRNNNGEEKRIDCSSCSAKVGDEVIAVYIKGENAGEIEKNFN